MKPRAYRHLYGPVPSRRLGRSLGVDLIPFKICTYDCVYCQLGRTTRKTMEREAYIAAGEVLAELENKLKEPDRPDYITLAGSGEPTLNADIGAVVSGIKQMTDIPVAVITNGSLLWMDEVRSALEPADLMMPSLDAGDEFLFKYVNRPCDGISFDQMANGLGAFTRSFTKRSGTGKVKNGKDDSGIGCHQRQGRHGQDQCDRVFRRAGRGPRGAGRL